MQKNFLTELLANKVDNEHLAMAIKLDAHLHEIWALNAEADYQAAMDNFLAMKPSQPSTDFLVFILLIEAMLDGQGLEL